MLKLTHPKNLSIDSYELAAVQIYQSKDNNLIVKFDAKNSEETNSFYYLTMVRYLLSFIRDRDEKIKQLNIKIAEQGKQISAYKRSK